MSDQKFARNNECLISSLLTSIAWWVGSIMTSLSSKEHTMIEREWDEERVREDGTHYVHSIIILCPAVCRDLKVFIIARPHSGSSSTTFIKIAQEQVKQKFLVFNEIKFFNLEWFFFNNYFSLSHFVNHTMITPLAFSTAYNEFIH